MAENGERTEFSGTIAGQTVRLVTKDLLPILLLLGIFVLGVLAWKQNEKRLDLLQSHHVKFYELLTSNRENTREETQRILRNLIILDHNLGRPPEEHLPLGLNGAPLPKPPAP